MSPKLRAIAAAIGHSRAPALPADPKALLERLWESFDPGDVPQLTRRKLREAMRKAGLLG